MEAELAVLAETAGTTLVTLLTTQAWQSARDRFVGLWQRARPERAERVGAEVDEARSELLAAQEAGDTETAAELGAEWQGRVRRLLAARPDVADELRAALDELRPQLPQDAPTVTQTAHATGSSRVYQAGRDIHLGAE